ncbi:MAG: HDIG domain-containing protein [Deltaproteobacteria bacterium]|nr:HDIG domain-containing protein [Deltaproteobacteria bacterium]
MPSANKTKAKSGKKSATSDPIITLATRVRRFLSRGPVQRFIQRKWPLGLLTSCLIALFVSPHVTFLTSQLRQGDYAVRAIKAPRTLYVEDPIATDQRREVTAQDVPPVYDFDSSAAQKQREKVIDAFDRMRSFLGVGADPSVQTGLVISRKEMVEEERQFAESLGATTLTASDFDYLAQYGYPLEIRDRILEYIEEAATRRLLLDATPVVERLANVPGGGKSILVRDSATGKETVITDPQMVTDLAAFEQSLTSRLEILQFGQARPAQIAVRIALSVIDANLTRNDPETEKRREMARDAVPPVMVKYVKNQIIITEGERITKDKLMILNQIRGRSERGNSILAFIATTGLCFLLLAVAYNYGERNITKFRLSTRDLFFLGVMGATVAISLRLGVFLAAVISDAISFIPESPLIYALPIAASVMLIRVILNSEIAFFAAIIISIFSALLVGTYSAFALFVLTGSLAGTNKLRYVSKRQHILKAGVIVGVMNVAVVLCIEGWAGIREDLLSLSTLLDVGGAMIGGLSTGLVVLALLPVVEAFFGYTSNITLLELASLNHPLLKDMVLQAPGTYKHSSMVSSMAESAAQEIHANPLLAKVAGLYHDIGKMDKPEYFSENQADGPNPHDKIQPSMSALILIRHVRDGVDLARRHRLGDQIVAIIREHHGTSLIKEFYDAAIKQAVAEGQGEEKTLKEADFRYPGPKPQSREAALVMLANAVESACRALPNPTPTRLEQEIRAVVSRVFLDDQLAECDLTLKDLERVNRAFLKVLAGYYHTRIEYPEEKKKKEQEKQKAAAAVEETEAALAKAGAKAGEGKPPSPIDTSEGKKKPEKPPEKPERKDGKTDEKTDEKTKAKNNEKTDDGGEKKSNQEELKLGDRPGS